MKFFDWKIRTALILILMFLIFISGQFIIYNRYKNIAIREIEDVSELVTNYIDSYIDAAYNTVKSFELYQNSNDSLIQKNLIEYVEKNDGITSLYYFRNEDKFLNYNSSGKEFDIEEMKGLYSEVLTNDGILVKLHEYTNSVHIGKKLTGLIDSNSVIIANVDLTPMVSKLNNLNLYTSNILIDIKDLYGSKVYSNYFASTNEQISNDDEDEGLGLSSSYEQNIVKLIINSISDTCKLLLDNNDSTIVKSHYSSKFELFTTETYTDISDFSYNFSNRLIATIAAFAVLIYVVAILVVLISNSFGRTKMYAIGISLFEIIIIVFFISELGVVNRITTREIEHGAKIIYDTTIQLIDNQNNNGDLANALLSESLKQMDLEESAKKGLLNNFMYIINKPNNYIEGLYLLKNGRMFYGYPKLNNNIESLYLDSNRVLDTVYDDDTYIRFYQISKDYQLGIKFTKPNYIDTFKNTGLITKHVITEDDKENDNDLYLKYLNEGKINSVNDKLKIVKLYKFYTFKGFIFILDANGNVYELYDYEIPNDFAFILVIMFLVCIMEIFIDWVILLILKIRRNKREKYDNEVKRDMMLLDKLLKKINDDVSGINKSFGDEVIPGDEYENE